MRVNVKSISKASLNKSQQYKKELHTVIEWVIFQELKAGSIFGM
jgi:hypothetical protein